ncbi:MAG: class I SAM-dependent methyltransferase [Bacillota bacterium]
MRKIDKGFVKKSFHNAINSYSDATKNIGLWKSEEYVINKYFKKGKSILDIGCGTGRTTFELYKKGYINIIGLDLTPDMIKEANNINEELGTNIEFIVGDATKLDFEEKSFDYALFAFNGIMQIPQRKNRIKALKEIKRILKPEGIFIFTTHDREMNESYKKFWEREKELWKSGKQDERLYEYGDKVIEYKEEDRDLFIHLPNREEVINCLNEAGWELVEDFYRADLFEESEEVKDFSEECRFWVVKK